MYFCLLLYQVDALTLLFLLIFTLLMQVSIIFTSSQLSQLRLKSVN